ncbi:hypothetical protein C2E23DRAFT_758285 [Lenzites betulinus]|nr:hypothetical protein C2E23DRAFT_758285 [Lenzites betulinus]
MFFCRHQLLRGPAQRHFTSLVTTRNAVPRPRLAHPRLPVDHARLSHTTTLPVSQSAPSTEPANPDIIHSNSTPDELQTIPPPATETDLFLSPDIDGGQTAHAEAPTVEEVDQPPDKPRENPLVYYLGVREKDYDSVTRISSESFAGALWQCIREDQLKHIPSFVADAIHITDTRTSKLRGRKMIEILLSTLNHKRTLTKADVLALLRCLERNEQLRFLRTVIRVTMARTLMQYPPDELDREVLDLLVPLLQEKMEALGNPKLVTEKWGSRESLESTDKGIAVPRALWPLYRITLRLAVLGEKTKSSDLLAALVNQQLVDSQAIEETDLTSKDLVYVVLSVLARSCLKYGWFSRATTLITSVVDKARIISPPFTSLVEDWLDRALTDPREQDLEYASTMITSLLQSRRGYVLPADLLQRFYQGALERKLPEMAEAIYNLSRNVEHHSYAPPRGESALHLLVFLGTKSRNIHLARQLAQQVVDDSVDLSPHLRAPFIAQTAVLGFAMSARALWERYSDGDSAQYVVANGLTMIRLVSLFMRVADQTAAVARARAPNAPGAHRENSDDGRSDDQEDGEQPTSSRTLSQNQDLPASDAPPSPATPPPHGQPSTEEPLPAGGSGASAAVAGAGELALAREQHRAPLGFDALTHPELVAREADVRAFAARVYDAYRATKLPLERATHHDLTSLARGAAILLRDRGSLDVFMLMKARKMKLDMHDVNLSLGLVARGDPEAGAQYIQRMKAAGVVPDAVSFGTVIHWAAQRGNTILVHSLIRQAKEDGLQSLSFKTLASLLHATVSGKLSQEVPAAVQAQYAKRVVDMMLDQGMHPPPSVGRDYVIASLRAGSPAKAFEAWKLYIKGKVDAADSTQTRLRGTLARRILDHVYEGWLGPERGTVMLYELGYGNETLALARYRGVARASGRARKRPGKAADAGDAREG